MLPRVPLWNEGAERGRETGATHAFIRLHDRVDTAAAAVRDQVDDLRRLCTAEHMEDAASGTTLNGA